MRKPNLFLSVIALLAWFAGPVRAESPPNGDAEFSRVENETIFGVIQSTDQFSELATALETAQLTDVVDNPGAFTVFAPTNEAFAALYDELGVGGPADIPIGRLKQILLDHITDGALTSDELQPGRILRGFEGGILRIGENDAGELTVNGVPIAQADIMASNGIIHAINQVLSPSRDDDDDDGDDDGDETIFEIVQNTDQFSSLAAALEQAELTDVVANPGAFTVFAPTNEAFDALYDELGVGGPADIPIGRLKQILLDHITDGALSSDELQPGDTLRGFEGGILQIGENDAGELTVNGVPIAQADIIASNGIIHSVNQVLFPADDDGGDDGGDDGDDQDIRLVLVDARSDQDVGFLSDGDTVDLADFSPNGFNARALVDDSVGSVTFSLNDTLTRTESVPLFTLFPQDGDDYLGRTPAEGNYQLVVTPYEEDDAQGEAGESLTINFFVKAVPPGGRVTGLVLVDAESNQSVGRLRDGDTIDLAKFPDGFNARALVDDSVGSVTFSLNDTLTRTENVPLFTLFPQDGDDFLGRTPAEGNYQLVVTPYEMDGAQGEVGESLTINFFVKAVPPVGRIAGFMLVDAATNQDVGQLMDGDVINLANFPEGFSGRALIDGTVGSVSFAIDDMVRVEDITYFTLFEQKGNVYIGRRPAPGDYQLVITPYAIDQAAGEMGEPLTINFTIVGSETVSEARQFAHVEKPLIADQSRSLTLTAFPNPGADEVTMNVQGLDGQTLSVQVVDLAGRLVEQQQYTVSGTQAQPTLDLKRYESGTYVVSVQVGKLQRQMRVIR